MCPEGEVMKTFRIDSTELPVVWLGTSLFAGAGSFGEKAGEYHSRFYENPQAMLEVMESAAGLGWGIEVLAMSNIVKATDRLKENHPGVSLGYTCGIKDFATEVNSALKRKPGLVFLHPRVTDTATRHEVELYFRRVVEEWVLPAAATREPLEAAAKLEGTGCRALLVNAGLRGDEIEHAVTTVRKYGMKYIAEVQPVGNAKDTAQVVHAAVKAGADALVIGVTAVVELGVYMRALKRMGYLD